MTPDFNMKNVTVFLNYVQESTHNILQSPIEHGLNQRHGRTFGPILGLFLASLLSKALAKYAASSFLPIAVPPWAPHSHKPVNYISYNQIHQPSSLWQPSNPYQHDPGAVIVQDYHEHHTPAEQHPEYEIHPTEHIQSHETPHSTHFHEVDTHNSQGVATTIESPEVFDLIPSQSQNHYRRQKPPNRWQNLNYPPKRENQNRISYDYRNRNPINRYRTTTPYYDYNYDNYYDLATRRSSQRTRRPPYRRKPADNYDYSYENSEYNDSYYDDVYYERTTRPHKRRRKPTRKIKLKNRKDATDEDSRSSESVEISEENNSKGKVKASKVKEMQARQQATTTTTDATETSESTTTTEATTTTGTTTKSSTTPANQNTTLPTGYGPGGGHDNISFTYGPPIVNQHYSPPYHDNNYGYGPSHGNEVVSITYNPPIIPLFHHNYPYANWVPQEVTKNAIIQKVHDLVGYDEDFAHRT